MPIGIRPLNDFAFKKTFGSAANKVALVSLLNAILDLPSPINDVTIENPFNEKDFHDDKLSVVDVKAKDRSGGIYHVEVQLSAYPGLVQRIVFYGCEMYADQLRSGSDYSELRPAFSICLADGILWKDADRVHHSFGFVDRKSGRTLEKTLTIHILELGRYNLTQGDLAHATLLECWLYWLLNADRYEVDELLGLFPQEAIRQAPGSIARIAEITEDKIMYDAREKARRDQEWALKQSFREGETMGIAKGEAMGMAKGEAMGIAKGEAMGIAKGEAMGMAKGEALGIIKGKVELIRALQQILGERLGGDEDLGRLDAHQLDAMAGELQKRIRNRNG